MRFCSDVNGRRVLHAEGTLRQAPVGEPLAAEWSGPVFPTLSDATGVERTRATLYPDRFPHGPAYHVVDQVTHYADRRLAAGTVTCRQPAPAAWHLPLTLIDGALQIDSIARAGFDQRG